MSLKIDTSIDALVGHLNKDFSSITRVQFMDSITRFFNISVETAKGATSKKSKEPKKSSIDYKGLTFIKRYSEKNDALAGPLTDEAKNGINAFKAGNKKDHGVKIMATKGIILVPTANSDAFRAALTAAGATFDVTEKEVSKKELTAYMQWCNAHRKDAKYAGLDSKEIMSALGDDWKKSDEKKAADAAAAKKKADTAAAKKEAKKNSTTSTTSTKSITKKPNFSTVEKKGVKILTSDTPLKYDTIVMFEMNSVKDTSKLINVAVGSLDLKSEEEGWSAVLGLSNSMKKWCEENGITVLTNVMLQQLSEMNGDFDLISEEDFAELEALAPAEEEKVEEDSDEEKTFGVDDE